jgi:N-acetylglucosaminyldiphosphoundecaprenol N-acetyl-beta-D-mannosaminyltransferase
VKLRKDEPMGVKRFDLGSVPVDDITMQASVELSRQSIVDNQQIVILAVNPEKVITARSCPELLKALKRAELVIPDGIGAVIAARFKGAKMTERVPGAELMPKLCEMASQNGFSIYLFGASEETNAAAASQLLARYPGLTLAGRRNGYFSEKDHHAIVNEINSSGADLLFLALGSPKQELFIDQHRDNLDVKVLQGVGGTFDVLAGNVKRAPAFWRKLHLEWFYRLLSQPSRLLRQTALPKFMALTVKDLFFRK